MTPFEFHITYIIAAFGVCTGAFAPHPGVRMAAILIALAVTAYAGVHSFKLA